MANDYFDSGDFTTLTAHTLARASAVLAIASAVEAGFELLPDKALILEGRITYAADTGAADAYLVALATAPAAYTAGLEVTFLAANVNTGASTIDVNSLGVKSITTPSIAALSAGAIPASGVVTVVYDGTQFQLVSVDISGVTAAAASATAAAADAVSTAADAASTAADVVSTNADVVTTTQDAIDTAADVVSTNADVVLTGLDVVSTNADVVLTGLDVVSTNADVVSTNADAATTTQDAIDTAADVVTTNADVVLTGLDVVTTNADAVTTTADAAAASSSAAAASASAAGIRWKDRCINATTANITLSGEQTIDGVLTATSRILVKDQSSAAENGPYLTAAGAWARTSDADTWLEIPSLAVAVEQGTTNADTMWICSSDTGGTLDTTAITFVRFGVIPSTITLADESSDTTCFPLFATAASGNLGPKTGTNLTFNSSTGALGAGIFEPTADTSTGDAAAVGYTAGEGLVLTGQGTTSDVTIKNDAGATVLAILTGTTEVEITGAVDIIHTATENDEHTFELQVDAAGYGDVKAMNIVYTTGPISTGEDEGVILINIDDTHVSATGGDVFGLEVLATDGNADNIYGMKAGAVVGPILQEAGSFANPTTATNDTTGPADVNAMKDGSTGTNTTIFVANSDYILIGAAAVFTEIEFIIETGASNPGIKPTFGYSTAGAHTFTTFSPVDGTNGFRNTGIVAWDEADLTAHGINTDTGTYDIKITRTHASAGSVSLFYAKTAATVVYSWDKNGVVSVSSIELGNASDTTMARSSAGKINVEGDELNPMTTQGDMERGGASGAKERFAIGQSGQILGNNGIDPTWFDPTFLKNYVRNSTFTTAARGVSFTSATTPANNDDTTLLDGWKLLSDGNDIVDVTKRSDGAVGKLTYTRLDVETASKKFGIAQFFHREDIVDLLGGSEVCSISFNAKVNNNAAGRLDNIKAVLLSWTSTADSPTSDPISAWNAEDTVPTWAANYTQEQAPANLSVTTSNARYKIENIALDAGSMANIVLFIWADGLTGTVTDILDIGDVKLNKGPVATAFEEQDAASELARNQRRYVRMGMGGMVGGWVSTTTAELGWAYPVPMLNTPTITILTASGIIRDVDANADETAGGSGVANQKASSPESAIYQFTDFTGATNASPAIAVTAELIEASDEL